MPLRRFTADLTNQLFPFNYAELSSTVVISDGTDIARSVPGSFSGSNSEQQQNICQAYYMENVMPIARGFSSVSYKKEIDSIPGVSDPVQYVTELRDGDTGLAVLAVTNSATYVYDVVAEAWFDLVVPSTSVDDIWVGLVNQGCYIFYRNFGLYQYNFPLHQLDPVDMSDELDVFYMRGMLGVGSQLVFWDLENRFYWSAAIDPLDFTPSLSTGAGSTEVTSVISPVVTCAALGDDFLIYTTTNVVAARATGDLQFPFVFTEVVNSEGISSRNHLASNSNSNFHVTWTGHGFQSINVQESSYIWPELRDGISRGLDIMLDPLLEQPAINYIEKFDVLLGYASNNFITVSLRPATDAYIPYKQIYVYDILLNRWGRLVVDHVICFESPIIKISGSLTYEMLDATYPTYEVLDDGVLKYLDIDSAVTRSGGAPGVNIGIVTSDGRLYNGSASQTAEFAGNVSDVVAAQPRLFLGKYKLVRNESLYLQSLFVNNLINGRLVAHGHLLNGAYVSKSENYFEILEQPGSYNLLCSADSVSIEVNGTFVLTNLELQCVSGGRINPYGVPKRKKFYNYVNSTIYPLYVVDAITQSGYIAAGKDYSPYFEEAITSSATLISGELRNSLITWTAPIEAMQESGSLISGTLEQTLFDVYLTAQIESMTESAIPLSGTLEQTLFNITLDQYPQEFIIQSGIILEGTLV